ncbi:MAG: DUF4932 domain-containing protein [Lutibacter sp.]|jgi:hypothetical protein
MMRNRFLAVIGFLLIFSTGYANVNQFKTFEVEAKGIKIQVNTKLELFHIMAYLSNSNYINNFYFKYKSDIDAFFALNKNDNSVQFIKKFLQNYHAHLSINGQFFDENFKKDTSFVQFLNLDNFLLPNTMSNKSIIIDSLNNAVESFAKVSQFSKFIENHQGYYQQKIDEVAKEISSLDMINDFEAFWGTKKDNYTIVITMLEQDIHAYWFTNNNKSNCVFYLPPKFVVDNDAKFGNSDITNLQEGKMAAKDYIYYGATHEIGHSFLNPIMDNYKKQIDQIAFQYATADPSKITFLCESFLRSLTAYFLIKNNYEEFAQMVIQGEKQQGYVYNEIIVEFIKDYKNNRNNYKNFNDYVPVLLDKLKYKVEDK